MNSAKELYIGFRLTRTYLPEWDSLTDREKFAFQKRFFGFQELMGCIYHDHKHPRPKRNTNQCNEIPLFSSRYP